MEPIRPILSERTFERVVEQIANSIRLGEVSVGDRIPSERDLATGMQISRPSLREAVAVMEEMGILEVRRGPGGGIYIKSTDLPRGLLRPKAELGADELRSVLEARRLLEPRVAHLAAVYARDEDFERMQETIDAQKRILGEAEPDVDRFAVQDVHFHMRMAGATHNSTLVALMRLLQGRLEFARDLVQTGDARPSDRTVDLHERTLAAIRLADHDVIEAVMEEHIRDLELAWERTTESALVRSLPGFMVPAMDRPRVAVPPAER